MRHLTNHFLIRRIQPSGSALKVLRSTVSDRASVSTNEAIQEYLAKTENYLRARSAFSFSGEFTESKARRKGVEASGDVPVPPSLPPGFAELDS